MKLFLKKALLTGVIGLFLCCMAKAQPANLHQLIERLRQLEKDKDHLRDTVYAKTLNELASIYADSYPDSAILLMQGQAVRCRAIGFSRGEADSYNILGSAFQTKGDFKQSMDYYDRCYQLAEKINYRSTLPGINNNIGLIYLNQGNYPMALGKFYEALKAAEFVKNNLLVGTILNNIATIHFFQNKMKEAESDYHKMLAIAEEMSDTVGVIMAYNNLGEVNLEQNSTEKALHNLTIAFNLASVAKNPEMLEASTRNLGAVYFKLDSLSKAIPYFETAIGLSKQQGNTIATCKALIGLAKAQNKKGTQKEALENGLAGLHLAEEMGQTQLLRDASEIVSVIYEALGQDKLALKHYRVFKASSDSINNSETERAAATYKAEYEFSKKELEFRRKELQHSWLTFSAFAALLFLSVVVWMVNRNRKRLNHANKDLQHKNQLIATEKSKAEEALSQLKATQSQLIQAEKMASLGELTAGIAHEIQNPLNFVNNFSEVSTELVDEMNEEIAKGNLQDANEIANDLKQNLEKINHHGKRAAAIVKGMLQHSRTSNSTKEPTDINKLADEYLRLAYHGLRAKDKSFNATMNTDYDETIGNIHIIPQDIGRVLINLFNNAFYAASLPSKGGFSDPGYQHSPTVWVSTKRINTPSGDGGVLISVRDNGPGIPAKIVDKIFQPFFTTKPTGQGTGLGLSLSYDIITKGHGGELKVTTKAALPVDPAGLGAGSEFTIVLPA